MRTSLITPFLCLLPFLFSCKNTIHHSPNNKYQFALHLTTGAKYYFNINTETVSKVSVNGKDVETNNKSEAGLIYEVVNSTPDSIQIKLTYDQMKFALKNKAGEKEIDAANAGHSFDDLEKQLAAVKGASMNITLNKKGDILQVTGGNEIIDKLMAATNTRDKAIQVRSREGLNKLIGDDFVRNNLARPFKLFPDTTVSVGDTWKMKNMLPSEIKTDALTTCTLDDIAGNLAKVDAVSEINTNDKTTVMGSEVAANTKGTQEGHFETDITTGLMMNGTSITSMEGSFQLMGRVIPLDLKITKTITGKKI